MAEVAREYGLQLFHVHYAIPHAIAGFLAQQMLGSGAPRMVTTLHGTDITIVGQDRSFFEITRFGIERSDAVTAVSEFLQRMTVAEFQVGKPIDVIPNFVDLELYRLEREDRSALAAPPARRCCCTSRTSARSSACSTWCGSSSASRARSTRCC